MKQISFNIFLTCMFVCAALVLAIVWGPKPPMEILPQLAATAFVIGLSSFLLWGTRILLEIRDRVK